MHVPKLLPGLIAAMIALGSRVHGGVVLEQPMASARLGTNRVVRIYLPPGYDALPARRYPVLYVHDGQNAFSTVGTNVAFGWGNWELDLTVNRLAAEKRMREIIMVAVDCSAQRYTEYRGRARPYTASESEDARKLPPETGDDSRFQTYVSFLIDELKPQIDREYRTLADAKHTGALGSSMGGICSLALAWDHPEVFGQAASLSGAFQVEGQYFLAKVLRAYTGPPKPFRLYLDSGTRDYSGGDDGCRFTREVAAELRRIGWQDCKNLLHFIDERPLNEAELSPTGLRQDKWKEAQTSQHNEFYWRLRVWRALTFLFPPGE